jgi:hypothetical protein
LHDFLRLRLSRRSTIVKRADQMNSPAKWQATSCRGRIMRGAGTSSAQIFRAIGHRV